MTKILLFLSIFLITSLALAEYRVFQLQILTYQPDGITVAETQSFPHYLDPEQYRGYFPVKPNQKVQYTDTWLCPGRTSHHKPFCPNPRAVITTEGQDL